MRGKNILTTGSEATIAEKLGDDEEFEVTDKRTYRKRRKPEPESVVETVTAEDDEDPPAEFIDAEEESEEPAELFPPGTVGALLSQDPDDRLRNSQCNIRVIRKADSPGETFLKPCVSRRNEPPIRNIDLTQPQEEIEDVVRAYYGGGHYYLQIQLGNRMLNGWNADLGDDPAAIAEAKQVRPEPQPVQVAAPQANPLDQFLENIVKQKALSDALFGDERHRLEQQLTELRAEVAAARSTPSEPKSERLVLIEAALAAGGNSQLQDKLINGLFPSDEKGNRHWIADLADTLLENKDTILAVAGPLIANFMGGSVPQQMPQQPAYPQPTPPQPLSPPTTGLFARRQPDPEPEPDDTESIVDAETTEPEEEKADVTAGGN